MKYIELINRFGDKELILINGITSIGLFRDSESLLLEINTSSHWFGIRYYKQEEADSKYNEIIKFLRGDEQALVITNSSYSKNIHE